MAQRSITITIIPRHHRLHVSILHLLRGLTKATTTVAITDMAVITTISTTGVVTTE